MPSRQDTLFARLLCDVMIPAEIAEAIRAQGYDVAEARTLPLAVQQEDDAILELATRQRRVVMTCNYSDPQSNFCLTVKCRRVAKTEKKARRHPPHSAIADQQSYATVGSARSGVDLPESTHRG